MKNISNRAMSFEEEENMLESTEINSLNQLGWRTVENRCSSKKTNNVPAPDSKREKTIKRRTRLLNKELRKFARLKSYSQYVKLKTQILRNVSDDEDTVNETQSSCNSGDEDSVDHGFLANETNEMDFSRSSDNENASSSNITHKISNNSNDVSKSKKTVKSVRNSRVKEPKDVARNLMPLLDAARKSDGQRSKAGRRKNVSDDCNVKKLLKIKLPEKLARNVNTKRKKSVKSSEFCEEESSKLDTPDREVIDEKGKNVEHNGEPLREIADNSTIKSSLPNGDSGIDEDSQDNSSSNSRQNDYIERGDTVKRKEKSYVLPEGTKEKRHPLNLKEEDKSSTDNENLLPETTELKENCTNSENRADNKSSSETKDLPPTPKTKKKSRKSKEKETTDKLDNCSSEIEKAVEKNVNSEVEKSSSGNNENLLEAEEKVLNEIENEKPNNNEDFSSEEMGIEETSVNSEKEETFRVEENNDLFDATKMHENALNFETEEERLSDQESVSSEKIKMTQKTRNFKKEEETNTVNEDSLPEHNGSCQIKENLSSSEEDLSSETKEETASSVKKDKIITDESDQSDLTQESEYSVKRPLPVVMCNEIVTGKYKILQNNVEQEELSSESPIDVDQREEAEEIQIEDAVSPEAKRVGQLKRLNLLCSESENDSSSDEENQIPLKPLAPSQLISNLSESEDSDSSSFVITDNEETLTPPTKSEDEKNQRKDQTPKKLANNSILSQIKKQNKQSISEEKKTSEEMSIDDESNLESILTVETNKEENSRKEVKMTPEKSINLSILSQMKKQNESKSSEEKDERVESDDELDKTNETIDGGEKEIEEDYNEDESDKYDEIEEERDMEISDDSNHEISEETSTKSGRRKNRSSDGAINYVLKQLSKRKRTEDELCEDHAKDSRSGPPQPTKEETLPRPMELNQFVERQGLIKSIISPTWTIKDMTKSDEEGDEEIWLMEIPRLVLTNREICGKTMVIEEKTMRIGDMNYMVNSMHNKSLSCIMQKGRKKMRYKTVNINPVRSVIVQQESKERKSVPKAETKKLSTSVPFPKNIKSRDPFASKDEAIPSISNSLKIEKTPLTPTRNEEVFSSSKYIKTKAITPNLSKNDKTPEIKKTPQSGKKRNSDIWNIDNFVIKSKKRKSEVL